MSLTADTAEVVDIPKGVYFRGEDHCFEGQILDRLGAVVNIAAWTGMEVVIKESHASTVSLVSKTMSAGTIVITDGPNGKYQWWLRRADMLAYPEGIYAWSVARTDAGYYKVTTWGTFYNTDATTPTP